MGGREKEQCEPSPVQFAAEQGQVGSPLTAGKLEMATQGLKEGHWADVAENYSSSLPPELGLPSAFLSRINVTKSPKFKILHTCLSFSIVPHIYVTKPSQSSLPVYLLCTPFSPSLTVMALLLPADSKAFLPHTIHRTAARKLFLKH